MNTEVNSSSVACSSLWRSLGLKTSPFLLHTEYRGYALPSIWFRLLRSLQSFLRQDQLLALFYGPKGVGKRSLVLQWLRYGRVKAAQCHIVADRSLQPMQLLRKIAAAYDITLAATNNISVALESLNKSAQSFVGSRLLVIDCVDKLSLSTAAVVAKMLAAQAKSKRVSIKVIATLDSSDRLMQNLFVDALPTQQILRLNMQPYDLNDTKEYILHRLRSVGLCEQRELSATSLQDIYSRSEGIPEKINKICAQYSPKRLLKPIAVEQTANPGLAARFKKRINYNSMAAYAVAVMMSVSIAVVVMQRPGVTDGRIVVASSGATNVRSAAGTVMASADSSYDFFDSESFLKTAPAGRYALVLATFSDSKNARKFVRAQNLVGHSYYWLHDLKGKKWTAVVYGNYSSKEKAERALHQLPVSLSTSGPKVFRMPRKQNI
jgi:general secretion pathway protein A